MVIGDAKRTKLLNAEELEKNLKIDEKNYPGLVFWLEELGRFSCSDLDFTNFPPALILHGQGDMVVNVEQAKTFAKKIKNAQLEIIPNCGHCPHISHLQEVRRVLSSKL
jgi:pimeloyl-ACP methyl ester carboxylesterase